jgi:hypothetical protein
MFQFPRCPRSELCIHSAVTRHHPRRVAPFGFPRLNACPQLPEAFRRVATSFFGRRRQGIHRALSLRFSSVSPRHASLVSTPSNRCGGWRSTHRARCAIMILLASSIVKVPGGAAGIRTPDLRRAKAALSRLSYSPVVSGSRACGRSWTRTTGLALIRGVL